jgi:hypothetical protein
VTTKKAKTMPETHNEAASAQLSITSKEAQQVADLLRYAVSLNTTTGLIFPTQRRLATLTYKAVELAALILEGLSFEEAVEESNKAWTGSLEDDHRRALELVQRQRDTLREAMSGRLSPEQIAEYLEVSEDQFIELVRPNTTRQNRAEWPES